MEFSILIYFLKLKLIILYFESLFLYFMIEIHVIAKICHFLIKFLKYLNFTNCLILLFLNKENVRDRIFEINKKKLFFFL